MFFLICVLSKYFHRSSDYIRTSNSAFSKDFYRSSPFKPIFNCVLSNDFYISFIIMLRALSKNFHRSSFFIPTIKQCFVKQLLSVFSFLSPEGLSLFFLFYTYLQLSFSKILLSFFPFVSIFNRAIIKDLTVFSLYIYLKQCYYKGLSSFLTLYLQPMQKGS